MARPSAASLNSLAEVLRQAQPLYSECRLILNYLDHTQDTVALSTLEEYHTRPERNPVNNDAASVSLTVFERKIRYRKGVI